MSIIPSIRKNIVFNRQFSEIHKEDICKKVFNKIEKYKLILLYDISYNYSSEGGFELPKTDEWNNYLNNHENCSLHIYQSTRQLRFYTDNNNNIIGAKCKDNIKLFTDTELDMICHLINECINENLDIAQ